MSKSKGKTKSVLINEFNKSIDTMIESGIPAENLPSKIGKNEGERLTINDARSLVSTLNKGNFTDTIYQGKDDVALTTGMQEVDRIRTKSFNRYQSQRTERIKSLPSYQKQSEYSKRSLEFRGDVMELTEGGEELPDRLKAKRIRSHEQFYERKGGENLKKMMIAAIENQNTLIDLSDYIEWIRGIDADIIEDVYYSEVDLDIKEFYLSQYSDEFMVMLETYKNKIQNVAMQNYLGDNEEAEENETNEVIKPKQVSKVSSGKVGGVKVSKPKGLSKPKKSPKRYSDKQIKTIVNEGKFYTMSLKSGEMLGLVYKNKMNKSHTGYKMIGGKKKRVYYEETF